MFLFVLSRQRASPNTSPAERMSVSVSLQEAGRPSCESMWRRPAVHLRLTGGTRQQLLEAAAAQTCNEERRDTNVVQPQQKRRTKKLEYSTAKKEPGNSNPATAAALVPGRLSLRQPTACFTPPLG